MRSSLRRQGLLIALEMERRGRNLYRRARLCTTDPSLLALLSALEAEEEIHYAQFLAMLEKDGMPDLTPEQRELATAKAAEHFFPGGLMQVALEGALSSPFSLLSEAMQAERDSIAFYTRLLAHLPLAEQAEVQAIVREEEGHLRTLADKRKEYEGRRADGQADVDGQA